MMKNETQNDSRRNDSIPRINNAEVVKSDEEKQAEELDRIKKDLEKNAYVVNPEDVEEEEKKRKAELKKREDKKTKILRLLLLIGVIVITVTLVVVLTRKKDDNPTPQPTEIPSSIPSVSPSTSISPSSIPSISPSVSPSSMPSLNPTSTTFSTLKQRLIQYTPEEPFIDSSTPQFKALEWLADTDTFPMSPTNDLILAQRFALATLFFSTGGTESWENDKSFLSDADVCQWVGIKCYEGTNIVKDLDISKFFTYDKHCFFSLVYDSSKFST